MKNEIVGFVNYAARKIKKHSPQILLGVGLASSVVAVGCAIKASLDLDVFVDSAKDEFENLEALKETIGEDDYTKKQYCKDACTVYGVTALNFILLYYGAIISESVAISAILASYGKLHSENVSLGAGFLCLYSEYMAYRQRTKDRFGEEAEYEIYNDIRHETIETTTKDEKGKVKTTKEEKEIINNKEPRTCSFFVGRDYCSEWEDAWDKDENLDYLMIKIIQAQPNLNRIQRRDGQIWLCDIMKACNVVPTEMSRHLAIPYDYDHNGENGPQVKLNIYDSQLTDSDDKVLLVSVDGLVPYDIDDFDYFEHRRRLRAK